MKKLILPLAILIALSGTPAFALNLGFDLGGAKDYGTGLTSFLVDDNGVKSNHSIFFSSDYSSPQIGSTWQELSYTSAPFMSTVIGWSAKESYMAFSSPMIVKSLTYMNGENNSLRIHFADGTSAVHELAGARQRTTLDFAQLGFNRAITSIDLFNTKAAGGNITDTAQVFDLYGLNVAPTPIPAAAWMAGLGLAGLLGLRRKMK